MLKILSKWVDAKTSDRHRKIGDFRPKILKTLIFAIFKRLWLITTSTDFDEIFSIFISNLGIQIMLFKVSLEVSRLKKLENSTFTFFFAHPTNLQILLKFFLYVTQ